MTSPAVETMPLYQSFKRVRALKLASVEINTESGLPRLTPDNLEYEPFDAPPNWLVKYGGSDHDAGYYVVYDDGYSSWSPTKAFEEGYAAIVGQ